MSDTIKLFTLKKLEYYNEKINNKISEKQNATDESLYTTNKNIVAAINEVKNTTDSIANSISGINSSIDGINNSITGINSSITGINSSIDGINTTTDNITNSIDSIQQALPTYNATTRSYAFQINSEDGSINKADADYSFVIGYNNKAHKQGDLQAANTFVGGDNNNAYHSDCFVFGQGLYTVMGNQTILGKFNKGLSHWNDKPVIELGYGKSDSNRSTIFLVNSSGWTASTGGFAQNSIGDFAEYFEWFDGNLENEDRIGYMVQLEGDKIKLAEKFDNCIGIVTGTAAFVADSGSIEWHNRYLTDEWGRYIYEIDENGERIKKQNPEYDPAKEYIPREQRKEWSPVGLVGKVLTRQDGTLSVGDFAGCINGIATKSDNGYRVLKIINNQIALLLVK